MIINKYNNGGGSSSSTTYAESAETALQAYKSELLEGQSAFPENPNDGDVVAIREVAPTRGRKGVRSVAIETGVYQYSQAEETWNKLGVAESADTSMLSSVEVFPESPEVGDVVSLKSSRAQLTWSDGDDYTKVLTVIEPSFNFGNENLCKVGEYVDANSETAPINMEFDESNGGWGIIDPETGYFCGMIYSSSQFPRTCEIENGYTLTIALGTGLHSNQLIFSVSDNGTNIEYDFHTQNFLATKDGGMYVYDGSTWSEEKEKKDDILGAIDTLPDVANNGDIASLSNMDYDSEFGGWIGSNKKYFNFLNSATESGNSQYYLIASYYKYVGGNQENIKVYLLWNGSEWEIRLGDVVNPFYKATWTQMMADWYLHEEILGYTENNDPITLKFFALQSGGADYIQFTVDDTSSYLTSEYFTPDGPYSFVPDKLYRYENGQWAELSTQGAQGPQGPQGADGAQGPQGPAGPAGSGSTSQDFVHLDTLPESGDTSITYEYKQRLYKWVNGAGKWGRYIIGRLYDSNIAPIANSYVIYSYFPYSAETLLLKFRIVAADFYLSYSTSGVLEVYNNQSLTGTPIDTIYKNGTEVTFTSNGYYMYVSWVEGLITLRPSERYSYTNQIYANFNVSVPHWEAYDVDTFKDNASIDSSWGTPIWNSDGKIIGKAHNMDRIPIKFNNTGYSNTIYVYAEGLQQWKSWYFPTTGGTSGQVLTSSGPNSEPVWVDVSTIVPSGSTGSELPTTENETEGAALVVSDNTASTGYSWSTDPVVQSSDVLKIVKITQSDYDDLVENDEVDDNTLYIIIPQPNTIVVDDIPNLGEGDSFNIEVYYEEQGDEIIHNTIASYYFDQPWGEDPTEEVTPEDGFTATMENGTFTVQGNIPDGAIVGISGTKDTGEGFDCIEYSDSVDFGLDNPYTVSCPSWDTCPESGE